MTLYTPTYTRARDVRFAQPHILRNRIQRTTYELRFALPATIPERKPQPVQCSAIVPYVEPCLAIVPYQELTPKPPKIIQYPVVERKIPIIPYPEPPKREQPSRHERMRIFANALNDPNLSVDDIIALSDQHLMQTAREIYYGA